MTSKTPLIGLHALIVEDEYFIADNLKRILKRYGADSVTLSGSIDDARQKILNQHLNFSIFDINMHGEMSFALVDEFRQRNIPFAFVSGFDRNFIPKRFADVPNWGKPYSAQEVVTGIQTLWTRPTKA